MSTMKNKLIRHQILLERFAGTIANTIQRGIDEARNEVILRSINDIDVVDVPRLERDITVILKKYMNEALEEIKELARYEADFNVSMLSKELDSVENATTAVIVAALLNKVMPVGLAEKGVNRKIDPAFNKFAEQTAGQLVQPIRNIQILGGDVVGASEQVASLSGGLLSAQAKSLSRSGTAHASSVAATAIYLLNNIKLEEWVSVLDSHTTKYCRGQDGKIYEVGKGPHPPAHYNCRSKRVPLL